MFAQTREVFLSFLNPSKRLALVATGLLGLFLITGTSVAANLLVNLDSWKAGQQWKVMAVYLDAQGQWSDPVTWNFTVSSIDDETAIISISGDGASTAELTIDKRSGQVAQIWIKDTVRGESVSRIIQIGALSPVYPYLSAIPLFFPQAGFDGDVNDYQLIRTLNGRDIPVEKFRQTVSQCTWPDVLADLSETTRENIVSFSGESFVSKISVFKGDHLSFSQFWSSDYPWSLYTASDNCQAWLIK